MCGQFRKCYDYKANCNCDGGDEDKTKQDEGRIADKSQLPIRKLVVGGETALNEGKTKIYDVRCAPRPIGKENED